PLQFHSRPLPEVPGQQQDSSEDFMAMEQQQQQQQHAFQSRQLLSSSQENLLASFGGGVGGSDGQGNNGGNDPAESLRHIYVALYDFNSGGENQLTIRKDWPPLACDLADVDSDVSVRLRCLCCFL
ncbi:hypothetical protein TYRP_003955, partial [Tyrophagus putrescentiae]